MNLKILFLLLAVNIVFAEQLKIWPFIIQKGLETFFSLIKKANITLNNISINFDNDIAAGYVNIKNPVLSGLETINVDITVKEIETTEPGLSLENISLPIKIDYIDIAFDYDLDMGVLDKLPLYGNGKFKIGLTNINLYVGLILGHHNLKNLTIQDLDLKLSLRHSGKNFITGLWQNENHNEKLNEILSQVITAIEAVICALYDYERECIDCVLSKVIQFVLNFLLKADAVHIPSINCTCLQEGNQFNLKEHIEDGLGAFGVGELDLWMKNYVKSKDFVNLFTMIYNDILLIVNNHFNGDFNKV